MSRRNPFGQPQFAFVLPKRPQNRLVVMIFSMRNGTPVDPVHQNSDLLRLPESAELQHTMLLYDAAVGLVRAMAAGLSAEGLKWSDFGLLLELDRLEAGNSGGASGVSRAFFLTETELSEAVLARAIKRLSGPEGWLEKFAVSTGGTPQTVRRDHRRHFVDASAMGSRMEVRLRFSTVGSNRWSFLRASLQNAGAIWLRGLEGRELSKHRFVLWTWRNRMKDLQAAGRASRTATIRQGSSPTEMFDGSLGTLITGISNQNNDPNTLALNDSTHGVQSPAPAKSNFKSEVTAPQESTIKASPLENVFEVVRIYRRMSQMLDSLLDKSGMKLQEADVLTYLGIAPLPEMTSGHDVVNAGMSVGGWFEYSELRTALYHTQGMSQPQFSRLLAQLAGEKWIEFSWKVENSTKVALDDAPLGGDEKPDLVRRWVRLTKEGHEKILPVWEDYIQLSKFLCVDLPVSWLESLDGINHRLAMATPTTPLPSTWSSPTAILEEEGVSSNRVGQYEEATPGIQEKVSLTYRWSPVENHSWPSVLTQTSEPQKDFTDPTPQTGVTEGANSPGSESPSTDPLIQNYLDTLFRLNGNATHQEVRHALALDESRYWELFALMRHRQYVCGQDGGLTVQLGPIIRS